MRDRRSVRQRQGDIAAVLADQTKRQGDHHWVFIWLAGRWRHSLFAIQRVGPTRPVETARNCDFRCASLAIPAHELCHVAGARICEALDKLFDSRRLTIVTRALYVHSASKGL